MNFIFGLYRKFVPDQIRQVYNEQFQKIRKEYKNKRAIRRRHYGTLNRDKTFYVICSEWPQSWGVATTVCIVLNNIKYAIERGWIPIVDYRNCYLPNIQDEEKQGRENAWEYYFEQPVPGYSLEDVYQSRHVILAPEKGQPYGSMDWKNMKALSEEMYTAYFAMTAKYIRIQADILERAEEIQKVLFGRVGEGEKVLGIGMRASLYWGEVVHSGMYANHPKGLSIDEYIEYTHRFMREFDCEYIFVSCDDRYYMERMKREFGDRCLYMSDRTLTHFFDREGKPILENEKKRTIETVRQNTKQRSVEYLIEVYLLSKCDSLFRVQGGGSVMACLLNNRKYEHYYLVDRGIQ